MSQELARMFTDQAVLQAVDLLGLLLDSDWLDVLVLVDIRGGEIFVIADLDLDVGQDPVSKVSVGCLLDLLQIVKGLVSDLELLPGHLLEDFNGLVPGKGLGVGPDLLVFGLRVKENGDSVLGNVSDVCPKEFGVAITSDESPVSPGIEVGAETEEEVVETSSNNVGPLESSLLNLPLDLGLVGEEGVCLVSPVSREL